MSSLDTPLILIVEDDDTDFDLLVEQLVSDYLLYRATTGPEAIHALYQNVFHAAIIDLKIPGQRSGADVSLAAADRKVPAAVLTNAPAWAAASGVREGSIFPKTEEGIGQLLVWLRSIP